MAFNPFHARRTEGACIRCGSAINEGDVIQGPYNRPRPRSYRHLDCANPRRMPEAGPALDPAVFDAPAAQPEAPAAPAAPAVPVVAAPPPAPGSIDSIIEARIRAILGEAPINAATLEAAVQAALDARPAPHSILDVTLDGEALGRVEGQVHPRMPRLLKVLQAGLYPYLYGPAGTGKTTAAMTACVALGRSYEVETLDRSTPRSTVFGYRTPGGEPVTTAFSRCYTEGKVYIMDEADLASAEVQTLFNAALANGEAAFAWGMEKRHPDFAVILCANTPGFGPTPTYRERFPLSAAFRDRAYHLYWPRDPNVERAMCERPLVKAEAREEWTCSKGAWGSYVDRLREWASTNAPTLMVHLEGIRVVRNGLLALAAGETPEEAADGCVFRGADETLRSKALAAVAVPRS